MPRCEGRPDGPCPAGKNDNSVRGSQGDLMLCRACEEYRFPYVCETRSKSLKSTGKGTDSVCGKKDISTGSKAAAASSSVKATSSEASHTGSPYCITPPHVIVNELLAYVCHYRSSCTQAAMARVICSFYTSTEITAAKKCMTSLFEDRLSDFLYLTERRSSASRPAHEAELDDVLGAIDLLDTKDMLNTVVFAAVNLTRLPGYGPEETNVCAIAERQSELRASVSQLNTRMDAINSHSGTGSQQCVTKIASDMSAVKDTIAQMEKNVEDIRNNVNNIVNGVSNLPTPANNTQSRDQNVVVFGISETTDWRKKLTDVLHFAAGREVAVHDAFRVGRVVPGKHRPIIVKLHSIWDRRLLLSNSRQLASCADYMRNVYIAADETLAERRKRTINRLFRNARRDQKDTELSEDGSTLMIDGVLVYSLKDGPARRNRTSGQGDQGTTSPTNRNGAR